MKTFNLNSELCSLLFRNGIEELTLLNILSEKIENFNTFEYMIFYVLRFNT